MVKAQKRKNVTLSESQTNGCTEYYCDNEFGGMNRSICKSFGGVTQMCLNEKTCIVDRTTSSQIVEIELESGQVNARALNSNDALNRLSNMTGIDTSKMKRGWDTNDQGFVVHLIIFLGDDADPNKIVDADSNSSSIPDSSSVPF